MTIETTPATAASVLFGDYRIEGAVESTAAVLEAHEIARDAMRRAPALVRAAAGSLDAEIARALTELLKIDLGSVVVAGWQRYRSLRAAAERTRGGGRELVVLAKHEVQTTQKPHVAVYVDEMPCGKVNFEITIVLELRGVVAAVANGMLAAVRAGDCVATVTVGVHGVGQIMQREKEFPIGMIVRLRQPISLVGASRPVGTGSQERPR